MNLQLQRTERGIRYTMGCLSIDGVPFCDTLEPTDRLLDVFTMRPEQKIPGRTAIPAGSYPVVLTYSAKFRQTLPLLLRVPYFEGIRIHAGNTAKDTAGCILVGRRTSPGQLSSSRFTLQQLLARLSRCSDTEGITLTIR